MKIPKGMYQRQRIIIALSVLFFLPLNSYAIGIGVSPGSIDFKDVLRSGYAERTVSLSTSSTEPLECEVVAEGPFKTWLTYEPGQKFILSPQSQTHLKIIVQPPEDVANGEYNGYVVVKVLPPQKAGTGMGSSISAAVSIITSVAVSDVQNKHFQVLDASVKDTEEKMPIEFSLLLQNDGNVRMQPKVHVDILSEDRSTVLKSADYQEKLLLPTTKNEILITVPNDLALGKYSSRVSAYLDDEKVYENTLDFQVLEKGSLKIQGKLLEVRLNKIWVYTGELIEITALFRNDGVLSAPAVFKGKVSLDDSVIDLIQSDEIDVPAGQQAKLTAYFTPKRPGRYTIAGRIYFAKKATEERSSILNVKEGTAPATTQPEAESGSRDIDPMMIGFVALALILVAAAFFLMGRKRGSSGQAGKSETAAKEA